jgi:hypothetical protein
MPTLEELVEARRNDLIASGLINLEPKRQDDIRIAWGRCIRDITPLMALSTTSRDRLINVLNSIDLLKHAVRAILNG